MTNKLPLVTQISQLEHKILLHENDVKITYERGAKRFQETNFENFKKMLPPFKKMVQPFNEIHAF